VQGGPGESRYRVPKGWSKEDGVKEGSSHSTHTGGKEGGGMTSFETKELLCVDWDL